MTDNLELILAPNNWIRVNITATNINEMLLTIPRKPGVYNIYTNAPKEVLQQIGMRNNSRHYNFAKKINATNILPDALKIIQRGNNPYLIYNGHQANLRQRASEHFNGSQGTGCSAFFEVEMLRQYSWIFEYIDLSRIENYIDSKLARTYIEQFYRAKTGWPILCDQ